MKTPRFVTFTGLDDRVNLDGVVALSEKYPINWGVLVGGKVGKNRYPLDLMRLSKVNPKVRLSLHLCGQFSFRVNAFGDCNIFEWFDHTRVEYIQINSLWYGFDYLAKFFNGTGKKKPLVLQTRTSKFPDFVKNRDSFFPLFDISGGRGKLPLFWPPQDPAINPLVGYAGGINPENVKSIVFQLGYQIGASAYWIDMESGVRDNADWLDLAKCEAVCKQIWSEKE